VASGANGGAKVERVESSAVGARIEVLKAPRGCPHPHGGSIWGGDVLPPQKSFRFLSSKKASFSAFWD